jgi:LytS/YehU family sensor histidine kinase
MHRNNGGELSISLTLSEKDLICKIEDNGIGRKSASAINTDKSHESFSTSAAKDRFKLLSEEYGKEYAFRIDDLEDENGKGIGTIVSFKLPYELKKS